MLTSCSSRQQNKCKFIHYTKVHTVETAQNMATVSSLTCVTKILLDVIGHTWLRSHPLFTLYGSHEAISKQRYQQTAHLKAESVRQKSLNLVTRSLARLDLFPAHTSRAKEKLIGRSLKENSIVNSMSGINSPGPFICSSRKKQLRELSHPTLLLI